MSPAEGATLYTADLLRQKPIQPFSLKAFRISLRAENTFVLNDFCLPHPQATEQSSEFGVQMRHMRWGKAMGCFQGKPQDLTTLFSQILFKLPKQMLFIWQHCKKCLFLEWWKKIFYSFDLVPYLWWSYVLLLEGHVYAKKFNSFLEAPESFGVFRQHTTCHFSLINCSHLRTSLVGFHKGFLDRIKQC